MSMTDYSQEPDMSYWDMYLADCKAEGVKPSMSDYHQWYKEMEADRKEAYEQG